MAEPGSLVLWREVLVPHDVPAVMQVFAAATDLTDADIVATAVAAATLNE